jgi:hypothetical protein
MVCHAAYGVLALNFFRHQAEASVATRLSESARLAGTHLGMQDLLGVRQHGGVCADEAAPLEVSSSS